MNKAKHHNHNELFLKAAVPLCILTKEKYELTINNSFEKTFGYSHYEIPTLNEWLELSLPDKEYRLNLIDKTKNSLSLAKSENRDLDPIEYNLTCKNGDVKSVLAYISFFSDEYLITFIDITLRTKFNAENELLRNAINSSSDSVFIIDMNTDKFIYVNDIACKKLEYTRDELLNLNIFQLDPVLTPEQLIEIKETINDQNNGMMITQHRTKNGKIYPVEVQNTLYKDGNQKYAVSIVRDISDRVKHEQELIESERKFRSLAETIPDNIVRYDLNCKPTYMNTNLQETINSKFEDIKDLTTLERAKNLSTNDAYIEYEKNLLQVINTGIPIEFEFNVPELQHKESLHLIKMVPEHNNKNEITGVLAIGRDITERKIYERDLIKSKEKAEESDKLKSAFIRNLSHEIRTPLNGIVGTSHFLMLNNLSKEEKNEYINMIDYNSKRLIDMVENMIEISKIAAGQIMLNINEVSVNELFNDIIQKYLGIAHKKELTLANKQSEEKKLVFIKTDEYKLELILSNLINNAIKFTNFGSIELDCIDNGSNILISVKDTGIGIASQFFDKIFHTFFQVDGSLSRGFEGAGLGLSICKGLTELLGGKIWVESELGVGSTFFISLPIEKNSEKLTC